MTWLMGCGRGGARTVPKLLTWASWSMEATPEQVWPDGDAVCRFNASPLPTLRSCLPSSQLEPWHHSKSLTSDKEGFLNGWDKQLAVPPLYTWRPIRMKQAAACVTQVLDPSWPSFHLPTLALFRHLPMLGSMAPDLGCTWNITWGALQKPSMLGSHYIHSF